METNTEFNTVYSIVEHLLKTDERCRNDDKFLTWKVLRYYTKIYIPFDDFEKIPAFETIKRTRAKIQNTEQRLRPTIPDVIRRRKQRQDDISNWAVK